MVLQGPLLLALDQLPMQSSRARSLGFGLVMIGHVPEYGPLVHRSGLVSYELGGHSLASVVSRLGPCW